MFISQVSLCFEDKRSEQLFRKHYAHLHLITASDDVHFPISEKPQS
jgi:hypothetical protein